MDRLTDGRKTVSMCISPDECFRYNRLAAYEDNGQTPEEQAEMIAESERLRKGLEAAKRDFEDWMRNGGERCKYCAHDDECEPGESRCYANVDAWEWRGPRAENGGAE